jgi:DNA-binding protein Fis
LTLFDHTIPTSHSSVTSRREAALICSSTLIDLNLHSIQYSEFHEMILEQIQQPNFTQLIENCRSNQTKGVLVTGPIDHWPVVHCHVASGDVNWLFSEYDPVRKLFYGIGDFTGRVELTAVSVDFLEELKADPVICNLSFTPKASLMTYLRHAYSQGKLELNVAGPR